MSAKIKKKDCSCTGSTPGNPKYGHGPCFHVGGVRSAVRQRIDGKNLARAWLEAARGRNLDDVDN